MPPVLVQVMENVYGPAVVIGPTCWEPPAALFDPLQYALPVAVQDDGLLVALQVTVVLEPVVIVVGETEIFTTGVAMTVRLADLTSDPALLLHVIVYVNVPAVFLTPVLVEPLAPGEATQAPDVPLATQEVGLLVALQLTVALPPVPIEVGETEIVTTGADTAPPLDTVRLVVD